MELGIDSNSKRDVWEVKEVEVHQPTKGRAHVFTINKWIGGGQNDGKNKFFLDDSTSSTSNYKPLIPYKAYFYTGAKEHSGTDCDVTIKLFGFDGESSDVKIQNSGSNFTTGKTSVIPIELEDVGLPKKLRVKLLNKKSKIKYGDRWFLEKVELCNTFTDKSFIFPCDMWISTDPKSGILSEVDLPSLTAKGKASLSAASYVINVKTSDIRSAGTDANVSCVLFGEHGDSGELLLKDSETHHNKFERNHTDVFRYPNMLNLGRLTKLRIWHDNSGFSASWHLDSVEVTEETSGETYTFTCSQWLSNSKDDKQLCRELVCSASNSTEDTSSQDAEKYAYEIDIITGDKREAGTMHHAWIILHGSRKSSKQFWIDNSTRKIILQRGQHYSLKFKSKHFIGDLNALTLGHYPKEEVRINKHPDSERENSWYCQSITVTDLKTSKRYIFPCKQWIPLSTKSKDAIDLTCGSTEEDQVAKARDLPVIHYEISVTTADERGAGTDANVSITIFGENGDSGKRPLKQRFRNLFERGQTDVFSIEATDLGKLNKILIEHDNSGFGAGWLLDFIEVKNCSSGEITKFECGQWLENDGDSEISKYLTPSR